MASWGRSQAAPGLLQYGDVFVAGALVIIVAMMVIPVPPLVLDILLATNLTLALVVVLVTLYTRDPLQISVFPSLLLMATLYRLALNVSSTRLILLHAEAGAIIRQFGLFVVGGNPVVGFIVFCILVVIQFIVITRGAERVAEVAARFTLDAMPGKQMSIDADLNAGLIDEEEARRRRADIEREADFYGAMDGASKFVKGDAIAGIVITLINLLGGFIIGVVQKGFTFAEALERYSLLTVGDGLVTQIPALLISTAAGLVVTRAASEDNMGKDLIVQLAQHPRVLAVTAGFLVFFSLIPGLPTVPFLALAGLVGVLAWQLQRAVSSVEDVEEEEPAAKEEVGGAEDALPLIGVDRLEVELGYGLLCLADREAGGDLLERGRTIRRQLALELGLLVPPIRIRDNMQLEPRKYVIRLKGVEVASGEVFPDRYLALNPGGVTEEIEGLETKDPAFGLPALWIPKQEVEKAELAGYTVVDPTSVITTHLTEVIKTHAAELLGRQEVQKILDRIKEDYPAVVEELVPNILSLGQVQKVLQNLLRERVPIRDMLTILETLADHGPVTQDPAVLTEHVRQALSRFIAHTFGLDREEVQVITLAPEVEELVLEAAKESEQSGYLAVEPAALQRILTSLKQQMDAVADKGYEPVVLCSSAVRMYFRRLTERAAPRLVILSYNELDPRVKVRAVGTVTLS